MKKEQETDKPVERALGEPVMVSLTEIFQPTAPPTRSYKSTPPHIGVLIEELAMAKELLQECLIQLEYLDSRNPTGTTPPIINKLNRFFQ